MKTIAAVLALLAVTAPGVVTATTLRYKISGDGHVATFALDTHPSDLIISDAGYDFGLATGGTFDGAPTVAGVTFYANPYPDATPYPGGLTYLDNGSFYQFNWAGPQLYSGPESAPTLLAFGRTTFTDIYTGADVTISASVGAVPEPATWALMIGGFGLVGGALRARGRVAA